MPANEMTFTRNSLLSEIKSNPISNCAHYAKDGICSETVPVRRFVKEMEHSCQTPSEASLNTLHVDFHTLLTSGSEWLPGWQKSVWESKLILEVVALSSNLESNWHEVKTLCQAQSFKGAPCSFGERNFNQKRKIFINWYFLCLNKQTLFCFHVWINKLTLKDNTFS